MDEAGLLRFLRALRRYRGTLEGPDQFLLDTLVTAALTHTPDLPLPYEVDDLWGAYAGALHIRRSLLGHTDRTNHWATTPWGAAYQGCSRL